jgi:hypothetical protein
MTIPPGADKMLSFLNDWNALLASKHIPSPETLYHYTDIDGLKGILSTQKLWATNAVFLNDRTELLHSLSMLKRVIEDVDFSKGEAGKPNENADIVMQRIVGNFYLFVHAYLVCFCTNEDLLSQWRGYGRGGGYALGFKSAELDKLARGRIELIRVIYDEDEQRKQLCELCRRWREAFVGIPPESAGPAPWRAGELVFAECFSRIAIGFKSSGFREEDEWRLVYRQSQIIRDDHSGGKSNFRTRDGMLLPFVEIEGVHEDDNPTERLPIVSVNIGPAKYQVNSRFAVELYLKFLDIPLESIAIGLSPTPLRL